MRCQAYLSFGGQCEQALQFYAQALGAEIVELMHFADAPPDAGEACGPAQMPPEHVMHASLRIGDDVVMAADGMPAQSGPPAGFSLALTVDDEAAARRMFDALCDGGEVRMPLGPTFFAQQFGMVTDRFGVTWMIVLPA
ncbi:MAG: VOC family protein [Rhodocyclaceae bacterium]|nr:VOC family protein [Rhodocyclaceae bacterium]